MANELKTLLILRIL